MIPMSERIASASATEEERRGESAPVADLIERAFRFRGDVTLTTADGAEITGYLYNRDGASVQLFETATGRDLSLPYSALTAVGLTGRDTATGKHFESFQRRRARQ